MYVHNMTIMHAGVLYVCNFIILYKTHTYVLILGTSNLYIIVALKTHTLPILNN